MRDSMELFAALERSKFRRRFRLGPEERRYFESKGLSAILDHAREFILQRMAPEEPINDGRQTPMRGHPAFIAQHATATCCRSCLAKWHGIEKGNALSPPQVEYVLGVLAKWLDRQGDSSSTTGHDSENTSGRPQTKRPQQELF
jgi:hypothetical protein